MKLKILTIGLLALTLMACSISEPVALTREPVVDDNLDPEPAATLGVADAESPAGLPTEADAQEQVASAIVPIEVTYFTPPQAEGPYYTVDKPADRDNDLTVVAGASGEPAGEILEFSGRVYGASGMPIEGAIIEIWQTDHSGVYLHPNDPATGQRDPNFQFYGEATTEWDGSYWFRTILPGKYEPRPIHIHFKVRVDGHVVLISQFYFQGDPSLETDNIFTEASGVNEHLLITLSEGQDERGERIFMGEREIILNLDLPS